MMWTYWFAGIALLSWARDALPWGLIPAFPIALFFALCLRQIPRRIPPPDQERIRSIPPSHHRVLEMMQLLTAGVGGVWLFLGEEELPIPGLVFTVLAYLLVGVEAASRLAWKRQARGF